VVGTKSNTNEIFLMGDFNTRVGKEKCDQVECLFREEINNNGERLREICDYYTLEICSTFLNTVTYINLYGYRKPDTYSPLLMLQQKNNIITEVMGIPRNNFGLGHWLV
jgi:hypothetical protein